MNAENTVDKSFAIKDCALVSIATGKRAQNLKELLYHLQTISQESIYYHFWGWRLRPRFAAAEYNNDFAEWASTCVRDQVLAERLSVIDPTDFEDLEGLRNELVDVIEERLDESTHVSWSKTDEQFYFIRSQIVVFNTNHNLDVPSDLATVIPQMSLGSIFYHFIDARRRTEDGRDDFSEWLAGFGNDYDALCQNIAGIDLYFHTLPELRQQLTDLMVDHFGE